VLPLCSPSEGQKDGFIFPVGLDIRNAGQWRRVFASHLVTQTMISPRLSNLPTYDEEGCVRAVIEAPKGSLVKLKYDTQLGVFTVSRALPLGLSYPFDWGFVPSTRAPDGDPLDILVLHEGSTFPGVVLPCRPLGLVEMDEDDERGNRERNDRVIVSPTWYDRFGELERASELPPTLRKEIEQFFLNTTFFSSKNARVLGWKGPKEASSVIHESHKGYSAQAGRDPKGSR
jgi:inorganic pyrophosphatase